MSKKILFHFAMLLLVASIVTGCSKDKGDNIKNYLEYAGKSHPIEEAWQIFYGHYYGPNSNNISLIFVTDKHYVAFELFVPNGNTKLVAGVYQPDDSYQAFTIAKGFVMNHEGAVLYAMTDGTITIKLEGNVYDIDLKGTLEDNTSVKGKFSGTIEWEDDSEDDDDYYGSMTITEGSDQKIIDLELAQQLRAVTSTSNFFMLYFSGTFIATFNTSNLTASALPSDTYPISTATPVPAGASNVSLSIPGVSGVLNASDGSFIVKKNGSDYNITFSFTTNSVPERTVTGYYNGPIPLSSKKSQIPTAFFGIKSKNHE